MEDHELKEEAFAEAMPGSAATDQPGLMHEKHRQFTIVGMGGSTGSFEVIQEFLQQIPSDSGIAFVVVQHLDPDTKSRLPELLQRTTEMQVVRVEDGMKVQPNQVYVIPEGKEMAIFQGKLLLLEPAKPRGFRMPIDAFLQSLASDWGDKAVCIIFSGMGSDGELGAKFIKEGYGLVIVQEPATARYDSMPRSAIQSGFSDYIDSPAIIAERLLAYVKYPAANGGKKGELSERQVAGAMQKIFLLLRSHTGHDFSLYKKNTLYRRFERRIQLHQFTDLDQYVKYLQANPNEIDTLFRELLIGVTKFFRDAEAFETMEKKIIPELLKKKKKNEPFRAWIAGCSTGEEAYSIAILLRECLEKLKLYPQIKLQLYATDLDPKAIKRARTGLYFSNLVADVSPERLNRWFTQKDDQYQINQKIRETIVFAEHNLIKDASFIKLDLLCCRNLLIYFSQELQRKLIPVFHYTLNPGGVLFLGPSETIGQYDDLFMSQDPKWKLYQRRENNAMLTRIIEFPSSPSPLPILKLMPAADKPNAATTVPLAEAIQRRLLEKHTPSSVTINLRGDILYINGRTGKYMEPAPGQTQMNVFEMAREGLVHELRSAVLRANMQKEMVVINELKVKTNGNYQWIRLTVDPITEPAELIGLLVVVFEELPRQKRRMAASKPAAATEKDEVIEELEKELRFTREHLQRSMEEMETSFEELKSTNEELQSTNEELQSTNEESNTAKEEMQALNQELMTLNMEFRAKTEELTELNNDVNNLLNSAEVATIFLGNNLHIKRFTPKMTKIVNLIQSDVGRPVTHISSNLKYDHLATDVKSVIDRLIPKDIQVEAKNGQWYAMRIVPYRTLDNFIDGAVITFNEITPLKRMESERDTARAFASALVDVVREPLLALDGEWKVVTGNRAFARLFNLNPDQIRGQLVYTLQNGQWDVPDLRALLENNVPETEEPEPVLVQLPAPKGNLQQVQLSVRRITRPEASQTLFLLTFESPWPPL